MDEEDPVTAFPDDWVRASRPEEAVARICLGLTLYLDDCRHWSRGGAAEALRRFLAAVPKDELQWATTSAMDEWRRVRSGGFDAWVDALVQRRLQDQPRHLLWFRLADDVHVPRYSFSYREVDDARSARTGFLQIALPPDFECRAFRRLALSVTQCGSYWSGVGGYAAAWNANRKGPSFWPIHAWCRRYLGLDVQDPDVMAWHARQGLPGTGWLTWIGSPLAEALKIETSALVRRSWKHRVMVEPVERGALVQAGPEPDLGDLNRSQFPTAYADVAQALAPWLLAEPPELWGKFYEEKDTAKWMRRFVDPSEWT
jgi:hypothetical protein